MRALAALPGLAAVERKLLANDTRPRLNESGAAAKALAYYHDADAVDRSRFPERDESQYCHTCMFVGGSDGERWRPCRIFSGYLVSANGWCLTWSGRNGSSAPADDFSGDGK
jgi:hypothetical protein